MSFSRTIRNADQTFLDPEKGLDTQGKVDGYQHFFHLLQVAVDFYLHNDPLRPRLMPLADQSRKLYGDNVDAVYYFSQVRGDQEYVIRGRRFDSCYLSFCLYGGDPNGELADRVTVNVNHRDITFDEDGSFEIRFTQNPKGINEFPIDPDSVSLFAREYFFDRAASRESVLSIENARPQPPAMPLDDTQLARRIRDMAMFFQCTTWIAPLPVEFPVNEFCPPFEFDAEQGGWGTVDNIYCFSRFRLEEHQYLKITFRSPDACYWGFQTWNYLMQSTNYLDLPGVHQQGHRRARSRRQLRDLSQPPRGAAQLDQHRRLQRRHPVRALAAGRVNARDAEGGTKKLVMGMAVG